MVALIPVGSGSIWGDNEELRYALRSLEMYCPDIKQVAIVGKCPKWCKPDYHIPEPDRFGSSLKEANIINKIFVALNELKIDGKFAVFNDDHYLLKPYPLKDWRPTYKGQLRTKATNSYEMARNRTAHYLEGMKLGTRNYDVHRPFVMDAAFFKMKLSLFPWTRVNLVMQSMYYNALNLPGCKQIDDNKVTRWSRAAYWGKSFVSIADTVFFPDPTEKGSNFVEWVKKKYPKKSRYERD
jgi:hypothetical protein